MARINVSVGPCRLSYLSVFEPKAHRLKKDKDIEYSLVGLIPKEPTKQCPNPGREKKKLDDAVNEAVVEAFGKVPPKLKSPFRDGDLETDDENQPLYPGYWFFNASAGEKFPPVLFEGPEPRHITDTKGSKWKSGDWGQVKLSVWTWLYEGKQGCSLGLRGVRFTHIDAALGAGSEVRASDFEPVEGVELPVYDISPDDYNPFEDE